MVAGEILRFVIEKLFHRPPRNLDEELASLMRMAPGRIHSLSLLVHYRGGGGAGEYWVDGAFHERWSSSPGLPTYPMRAKVPFQSPAEPRQIWEWMLAAKAARNIPALYLQEYWFPNAPSLSGEALMDASLAEALEVLAAPLVSLQASAWQDDRGLGSGIRLGASVASTLPHAERPVSVSLYDGEDTPEEMALIRSWGERTAAAHNVTFRFE